MCQSDTSFRWKQGQALTLEKHGHQRIAPQASHNYSTSSLQREKKSPNMYLKRKGVFETSFVTFILVLYLWPLDITKM